MNVSSRDTSPYPSRPLRRPGTPEGTRNRSRQIHEDLGHVTTHVPGPLAVYTTVPRKSAPSLSPPLSTERVRVGPHTNPGWTPRWRVTDLPTQLTPSLNPHPLGLPLSVRTYYSPLSSETGGRKERRVVGPPGRSRGGKSTPGVAGLVSDP